jgi:DNA-binding MarR family transcriptional regulator
MKTDSFQDQIITLVRAFGWHRPASTPCGQPVPIAEAHALLELSKQDALTQRELALRIKLQKSTVSRLVSNLEDRGWVDRRRNDVDGRARDVFLTAMGKEAAVDLATARQAKMDRILAKISDDRRQAVGESLQILIEAIHESDE